MALVQDGVYTHPSLVSDDINTLATMQIITAIANHYQSMINSDGSSSSMMDNSLSLDDTIYRIISDRTAMQSYIGSDRVRNEFDLFIKYGENNTNNVVDTSLDVMNLYLSTLGV